MPQMTDHVTGTSAAPDRQRRLVLAQFSLLATVWGASFLFIKVGLRGLSPIQVTSARVWFGLAALVAISAVRRRPLPRRLTTYGHLLVVALLLCVVPFTLFGVRRDPDLVGAGQHPERDDAVADDGRRRGVPAVGAADPAQAGRAGAGLRRRAGGLRAVARRRDRRAWWASWPAWGRPRVTAVAFVYLRRFVLPLGLDPVTVALVQVGLAGLVLAAHRAVRLDRPDPGQLGRCSGAMLALGVVGTGIAYVLNTNVVIGLGATAASTVTYLTPVVGVLLGVVCCTSGQLERAGRRAGRHPGCRPRPGLAPGPLQTG